MTILKSLLRTNVLNDVTATPFSVSFSQLPAVKKPTENSAAVTSLRTFVFRYGFNKKVISKLMVKGFIQEFAHRIVEN